jgi:hypothetical protein
MRLVRRQTKSDQSPSPAGLYHDERAGSKDAPREAAISLIDRERRRDAAFSTEPLRPPGRLDLAWRTGVRRHS